MTPSFPIDGVPGLPGAVHDWPSTLDALAAAADGAVVPGHGDVVDRAYVKEQAALLGAVAIAARTAYDTGEEPELPLPPEFARVALDRAYRQLRGDPPNESLICDALSLVPTRTA